MAFEDELYSEICECLWCGAETMLVYVNCKDSPDDSGDAILTTTAWCLNDCCKFGRRGFGVRIEKELENG